MKNTTHTASSVMRRIECSSGSRPGVIDIASAAWVTVVDVIESLER